MTPKPLSAGDTIAIISTARVIDNNQLQQATDLFVSWGLRVVHGKNIHKVHHQFAGTDQERAADLQWAIDDDSVNAIMCFRGGYGSVRILDLVDFNSLSNNPRWICGYSDVTVLHNKLHALGLESIHSTMPVNFSSNTQESLQTLKAALFGSPESISIPSQRDNKTGVATGPLIGGNLSIIYSLAATDIDLNTDGKILLVEDLDEYLYHVDRVFHNLKRSGKLAKLAGLIVGGMTNMNDNTIPFGKTARQIIQENTVDLNIPICYDFPVGHQEDNRALILGRIHTLRVSEESVTLEPSVHS